MFDYDHEKIRDKTSRSLFGESPAYTYFKKEHDMKYEKQLGGMTCDEVAQGCRISDVQLEYDPTTVQIGGTHYKDFAIQPVEFITRNNIAFLPGCVIKRMCRYDKKGVPISDLRKARHEIDLILQLEFGIPPSDQESASTPRDAAHATSRASSQTSRDPTQTLTFDDSPQDDV